MYHIYDTEGNAVIYNSQDVNVKAKRKFDRQKIKREAQNAKDEKWHKVFCWLPVRISPHRKVWLQFMVRRKNEYWKWEYKTVPEYVKLRILEDAPRA